MINSDKDQNLPSPVSVLTNPNFIQQHRSSSNIPDILWPSIAPPHEETGWPADLVARAGMGVRGLVPRGTLFERYMTCPVEPTRNGLYQSLDKRLLL